MTYDPGAGGGTTNVEVDAQGNRIREYVSIAGTENNCAGGRTPRNTWLTCEETERRVGGTRQKDHGYVFEVDPFDQQANQDPVPLKFLGRPTRPSPSTPTPSPSTKPKTPPAPTVSTSAGPRRPVSSTSVRKQFSDDPVTRSRKLEGAWWSDGGAYFVASFARESDGSVNEHDGQVRFYDPATETVTLKTIFGVNPDPEQDTDYDGPDTITVRREDPVRQHPVPRSRVRDHRPVGPFQRRTRLNCR